MSNKVFIAIVASVFFVAIQISTWVTWVLESREQPVWVELQGDRVAVMARAPNGKVFGVMRFDRSMLNADSFVGFDLRDPEKGPSVKELDLNRPTTKQIPL